MPCDLNPPFLLSSRYVPYRHFSHYTVPYPTACLLAPHPISSFAHSVSLFSTPHPTLLPLLPHLTIPPSPFTTFPSLHSYPLPCLLSLSPTISSVSLFYLHCCPSPILNASDFLLFILLSLSPFTSSFLYSFHHVCHSLYSPFPFSYPPSPSFLLSSLYFPVSLLFIMSLQGTYFRLSLNAPLSLFPSLYPTPYPY